MIDERCPFCRIVASTAPAEVLRADPRVWVIAPLPAGRLTAGHTLVLPTAHIVDLTEADDSTVNRVAVVLRDVARAAKASLGATGVNVLHASGRSAGQSVFHLHFHVVPRWADDGIDAWPRSRTVRADAPDTLALLRAGLMEIS